MTRRGTTDRSTFDDVVVGAGFGGSACAALLAKAGLRIYLVDKNSRAGGKAMTVSTNGFTNELWPVIHAPAEADPRPLRRGLRCRRCRHGNAPGVQLGDAGGADRAQGFRSVGRHSSCGLTASSESAATRLFTKIGLTLWKRAVPLCRRTA